MSNQLHSTAVVCASGSGVSYGLIQQLRAAWGSNVRIIALDVNPAHLISASVIADEFNRVAPSNEAEFQEQLSNVLKRYSDAHVYPAVNSDFLALADLRNSKAFEQCDFVCVEDKYLTLVTDKRDLYRFMQSIGVVTPGELSTNDIEEAQESKAFFIKPRDGFGSRGARVAMRNEIMAMKAEEIEYLVVQEICSGPEVTIDAFIDANLGDYAVVCRERIEVKSGVCTKTRLFSDTALEALARRVGETLNIRGSFCIQVMRSHGEWLVTDLNLRPGAGTALSCAIGANFFSAMHASRCGERGIDQIDLRWIKRGDCFVTRQYVEYVTSLPR